MGRDTAVRSRTGKQASVHGLSWCRRLTEWFIAVLLSLFILICAPYQGITEVKYTLFLAVCGGYLALLLVSAAELMAIGQLRPRELLGIIKRQRAVWILAGIYLLFTAISALLSPYDYNIWVGMSRREGLLTQLIYIGVFLSVSAFGKLRAYHVRLFGAVMSVFCAICLLQLAGLNPFGLYPEGYNYHDAYTAYSGEYLGTIGNADLVSALLAMASALFYAAAFFEKGRARALDIALLFLTGFTLFAIRVAAGILAFIVTVLAATPLMLRKKHGELWKKFAVLEAALVLLALLAVFLFDFGGSGTLHELHELLHGRPDLSFGSGRFKIWREVLTAMKGHLLLGTGPDSMQAWELPGFTRYIESLGVTIESGIDMAHNEYLNVAAQQGLLAGAAFLALLMLTPAKALRRAGKPGVMLPLCAAAAYLVQALFGFSMCMTAPLFWAFLGLSISREESDDLYARNT